MMKNYVGGLVIYNYVCIQHLATVVLASTESTPANGDDSDAENDDGSQSEGTGDGGDAPGVMGPCRWAAFWLLEGQHT